MGSRKLILTDFGSPEVLEVVEEPRLPEPGPGEVRVKTLASGVAFTDVMIRKGVYPDVKAQPPFCLGYDLVGEVDKVGQGVDRFDVGDRVAELTVIGAQAEYVCLDAAHLVSVPRALDPARAVSLVLTYTTAYQMLIREADVQADQRILVHGAGGAVGSALTQLGMLFDLEVYGTASSPKHDLVSALGAVPIDYREEDFVSVIRDLEPPGVDVVFDHIGGVHLKRSLQTLRPGGRLIAYGFYNATMGKGGSIPLDFLRLQLWNLLPNQRKAGLYSIGPLRKKHPDWFAEDLGRLFQLTVHDAIQPVIWKRISLDQIPEAHRWIEAADARGKIVCVF